METGNIFSNIRILFFNNFFPPSADNFDELVVLSRYIHILLSKVLFVDGEPSNFNISFLFDLLTISFSCFFFKK